MVWKSASVFDSFAGQLGGFHCWRSLAENVPFLRWDNNGQTCPRNSRLICGFQVLSIFKFSVSVGEGFLDEKMTNIVVHDLPPTQQTNHRGHDQLHRTLGSHEAGRAGRAGRGRRGAKKIHIAGHETWKPYGNHDLTQRPFVRISAESAASH